MRVKSLIAALAVGALCAAPVGAVVRPGDVAPGFTLQDANNVEHSLGALRGKVVLLAFVGYG